VSYSHVLLFTVFVLGASIMDTPRAPAADHPEWAIVIHGGAGGDPAKWDEQKIEARKRGLEAALQAGRDSLAGGGSAIDTVEIVIRVLEDDASFNAGRGAVVTQEGRAELDASIMDGKTLACGAVAGITTVKNPISLARRVMTETKHVLLVGEGAEEFAKQQGVPLVDPDYFLSRRQTSQPNSSVAKDLPSSGSSQIGTVGCVVLDADGNLAAGTSTGGTSKKLPGRVGDSPIVGAGTYAANDTCAVSGTGIGEEYIRNSVAYDVSAQMRYAGQPLTDAVSEIMRQRLKPGVGGLIAVSHQGEIVMQHNTPGMSCGAADSDGRFETHLGLERGGAPATSAMTPEAEITALIQQQARDWNAGDIEAFMKVYWKNDQLTFSSGGNITRGFDSTLARYKQRYPTAEAMGKVTFSELEFLPLGRAATQVLGVWKLERDDDPIGGRFTLVFRRLPDGWKIVHDHTSMSEKSDTQ
jgi:isoaspartyl peptidase/L-asparaginase-like protein (Ntn-hydrolase superfamily)/ketosteroid isomerase-like protein